MFIRLGQRLVVGDMTNILKDLGSMSSTKERKER